MRQCQSCGRLLSVHGLNCPACGTSEHSPEGPERSTDDEITELTSETGAQMTVVARFTSSAEAGYFADELEHAEKMEVKLAAREHFDALTGRWRQDYVLVVEEAWAERAFQFLDSATADADEPDHAAEEFDETLPGETSAMGVNWMPILLTTLAAGSVAYWGAKKIEKPPCPPVLKNDLRIQGDDLWDALSAAEGSWIQHFGPEGGVRLLHVAPDGSAVLQEDRDGDGRFEQKFHFRR